MMNEPIFQAHEYPIGGKLVVGRAVMDESFAQLLSTDVDARMNIKKSLAIQMAEYMIENNLVEFTQQDDPLTMRKAVMVRAYLAPNDQIKILRVASVPRPTPKVQPTVSYDQMLPTLVQAIQELNKRTMELENAKNATNSTSATL